MLDNAVRAVHSGLIALIALAFLYRLWKLFTDAQDGAARAVLSALACLELIFLIGHPDLYWIVYRALGEVPSLPQFLQHIAAVALAFYAKTSIILVAMPADQFDTLARRTRNQRWRLGICLACLVACYVLGPLRAGLPMLSPAGAHDGSIIVYVVTWQSYIVVVLVDAVRLSFRLNFPSRIYLRIGLRLLMAGYILAIINVLHKIGYQLAAYLGVPMPWLESGVQGVQTFLLAPVVACLTIGLLLPSLGTQVTRRAALRRAYHEMAPLAELLEPASAKSGVMTARGSRSLVLRRIVVIRDALIGPLRGYLDSQVFESALNGAREEGKTEEQAHVIAEATCIAIALQRRADGARTTDSAPPALTAPPDWESEMKWLAMVSRAYASNGLARDTVARLRSLEAAGSDQRAPAVPALQRTDP